MAPKTFKGYVPVDAPSFDLESADGITSLHVTCVRFLPGSQFLDFLSNVSADSPAEMATTFWSILKAAVVDEEWEKFKAFIDDPANGIAIETLAEIAGYLGELYSNRPTMPPQR